MCEHSWVCRSPSPAPQSKAKAKAHDWDEEAADLPPPPKRSEAAPEKGVGKGKDADEAMPDAMLKSKSTAAEPRDVDKDAAPKVTNSVQTHKNS